jgi:hypothetical protein
MRHKHTTPYHSLSIKEPSGKTKMNLRKHLPKTHLWDKFEPFPEEEEPYCQVCLTPMRLLSHNNLKLKYECDVCHDRLIYTSRNNERMEKVLTVSTWVFILGVFIGMLIFIYFVRSISIARDLHWLMEGLL